MKASVQEIQGLLCSFEFEVSMAPPSALILACLEQRAIQVDCVGAHDRGQSGTAQKLIQHLPTSWSNIVQFKII